MQVTMIHAKNIKALLFSLLPLISSYLLLHWYTKPHFEPIIADYIHTYKTNPLIKNADTYKYAHDYYKAISVFEEGLNQNILSEDERIYTLNQLAYIHLKIYKDSIALAYLNKIETEYPYFKEKNQRALADFCFNHGLYCYQNFRPKEAEFWLRRALDLYKLVYKGDHLRIAECLNTIGMYYYEFGVTMDSAIKYIPLAHNIFKNKAQLRGHSHENELAMAQYNWIQRNSEAGQTHSELALSLEGERPLVDSVFLARCYSMKGNFIKKRGQIESDSIKKKAYFKEAEFLFKKAIQISENSKNVRIQEFYRDLIINYSWLNDSLSYFNNLTKLESILKTQTDRYGQPDRLKGYFNYNNKNLKKSILWYEKFYTYYVKDSLKSTLLFDETLYSLSMSYKQTKNFDNAIHCVLKSIELFTNFSDLTLDSILNPSIYKLIPNQFITFEKISNILLNKYKFYIDLPSLIKSYEIVCLADDLFFSNIISVDEAAITEFQNGVAESLYSNALEVVYELYKKTHNPIYLNDAFRFCEKTKSFLLFRELPKSKEQVSLHMPKQSLLDSVRQISAEINKLRYLRDKANINMAQSQTLVDLQDNQKYIYQKLKENYPEYYRQKINQPVPSIQELKASLNDKQILVQYSVRNDKVYALFIKKDTTLFYQKDSVNSLNEHIVQFLTSMKYNTSNNIDFKNFIANANWLYKYLLGYLPSQFLNNKELIIIPDKTLNQIPFEALITKTDISDITQDYHNLPYLLNTTQIVYTPAWKLFSESKENNIPKEPRVLAMTYGDIQSDKALLYAEIETKHIEKNYSHVKMATNKECSKKYFLNNHIYYDILHLSLHAESSAMNNRDNKIYFKLPLGDTLYGFDIEKENFTAKLAVLSACQTASGKIHTGEGVYSLSRSFLQGGVKHIIASLWKVDDWATSELMKHFYTELAKGNSSTYAIHQAKLNFIRNPKNAQYVHPHFWSSFISIL